jgi:hypothetical protein
MLNRRHLLHVTAAGLATALLGCEPDSIADGGAVSTASELPPMPQPAPATALLDDVAPDRTSELMVINASFETLTGDDQLFAFGLVGPDNTPVTGADVQVWTRSREGDSPNGPLSATFREVPNQPLGLYVVNLPLPVAGTIPLAALTGDGAGGETLLRVADEESAVVPPPGAPAPVVATPTPDDLLGFERLCTLDPPCGMHEVSLDEAIRAGDPVVLTIATPGFCETAICGPTVEVVQGVRASQPADSTIRWIHLEVFSDAGTTVADPLTAWQLQSEPWIFTIGSDGQIAGRLDGPLTTLEDAIAPLAAELA